MLVVWNKRAKAILPEGFVVTGRRLRPWTLRSAFPCCLICYAYSRGLCGRPLDSFAVHSDDVSLSRIEKTMTLLRIIVFLLVFGMGLLTQKPPSRIKYMKVSGKGESARGEITAFQSGFSPLAINAILPPEAAAFVQQVLVDGRVVNNAAATHDDGCLRVVCYGAGHVKHIIHGFCQAG